MLRLARIYARILLAVDGLTETKKGNAISRLARGKKMIPQMVSLGPSIVMKVLIPA